ncbi:vesicular inhibitory amino acid transporter [Prorops nasuta]|uniref:vesicular inhibitory amino acid transporter n=1 Tax=Prorops nasuta TaxID=863751 RepID=UPI0034CD4FEF
MASFRGFTIPSLGATFNVAWATIKAKWPENSPCMELIRGPGMGPGQSQGQPGGFKTFEEGGENTEMMTMNGEEAYREQNSVGIAEDSFSYQRNGDKRRTGSASSGEFSEYDEGGGEFGGSGMKINEWQAAWNVTNAIQGMFIVSLPFAVLSGGYWAIMAMIGIAYICCYTGKCLVECLYELDTVTGQRVRVRDSYVGIAKECFGPRWGGRVVNIAQIIELLMTCILYVVLCGDLINGINPGAGIDKRSWMMLIGIFLLPLGFLKSLQHVSTLSFWCTMSHLFINVIIVGYCLLEIGDWGWSQVKWTIDMANFPISLGVIVFGYTSQIFLPTLEGNLIDRSRFDWMLNWSHIAAAAFKSIFGWVCFLTFQNDTQQIITNNLHSRGFKGLVNFCLVIKAVLSYPLPYYAACELLERALFRGRPKTLFPTIWTVDRELKVWGLAWRVGIIVFTILMACFIPHFSDLMGLIGSFTGTMLSFIWPCYFHLKLKRNSMEWTAVAYDCFVICLGVLFGVMGVYDAGSALIDDFEIDLPF